MRTGRYLLILVALLAWGLPAAETEPPDSHTDSDEDYTAADQMQKSISENINAAAQWIDSFFDNERFIAEDATTKLRLGQSVFIEHDDSDGPEHKTKVNLSIDIPKTKQRLRVFIASEDDTNKTPDTLFTRIESSDETSAAGVQYFTKKSEKRNLSLTAGIKLDSIEFFIGPRYRRIFKLDDWNLRFTQRLRWFSSKGWEATTRFDFERLLSEKLFFRHTIDGRWREEDEGYRYEIRPSLIQQLHSKKAIEYQWNTLFKTRPNHRLDSSVFLIRYRLNFKRKWLFYEINPQIALRNDEDFEPKAGITFQIEVVFGGKEFLKRSKEILSESDPLGPPHEPVLSGPDQKYPTYFDRTTLISDADILSWQPFTEFQK